MASFNTTVRHMTEMFSWPKCLSKEYRNVSRKPSVAGWCWGYLHV